MTNQIKTTKVIYHEKTPVKDVGTDLQRYQATQYFAETFNRLAENKATDFDQECNGYPVGKKIPKKWLTDFDAFMDTRKPGLRNTGHTKMLLNEKGEEKFSREEKMQLIEFLKTL